MEKSLDVHTVGLIEKAGALADYMDIRAYIVGGMVRDILLARKTLDIDIVTEGDGTQYARVLADNLKGAYKKFDKYKTAKIFLPNGRIDVSSSRSEKYEKPASLPDVTLSSLSEDLLRLDFSVNSMAISINKKDFGSLFDPFDAVTDLKAKILRTLHDNSFIDDPTRILRAIRFQSRLGFKMEKKSRKLFDTAVKGGYLDLAPGERLLDEIMILMGENDGYKAAIQLEKTGVLAALFPGIKIEVNAEKMFRLVKKAAGRNHNIALLNFMCVVCGSQIGPVKKAVAKLKMSNTHTTHILQAIKTREAAVLINKKDIKKSFIYSHLHTFGAEPLIYLKAYSAGTPAEKNIDIYIDELMELKIDVNGSDLKALGIKEGPEYTKIFEAISCAKIDGLISSRAQQLDMAQKIAGKQSGSGKESDGKSR
jgi:tRNA nucleotidyltransferase (CCA-adding enzyme)